MSPDGTCRCRPCVVDPHQVIQECSALSEYATINVLRKMSKILIIIKKIRLCHIFIQISVQHYALQVADRSPWQSSPEALSSTPAPVTSIVLSYANINKNNNSMSYM